MVDVRADLGRVAVTCEGRLAARCDRSWVAHQTVTDPARKAAADVMRAERARAKLAAPPAAVEAGQQDLSRYDVLPRGGEVGQILFPSRAGARPRGLMRNEMK